MKFMIKYSSFLASIATNFLRASKELVFLLLLKYQEFVVLVIRRLGFIDERSKSYAKMHQYHILFLPAKLKLSQISKAGGINDNFLSSSELIFGNDNDRGKVAKCRRHCGILSNLSFIRPHFWQGSRIGSLLATIITNTQFRFFHPT